MDMYPSGNIKILEITNSYFKLHVSVRDLEKLTKNRKINRNIPAHLGLRTIDKDTKIKTLESTSNQLVINNGNKMMPVFFENGQYNLILENKTGKKLSFYLNSKKMDDYIDQTDSIYFLSMDFAGDVGYTNLDIYQGNTRLMSLSIEVFPSKMDYQKDYQEMIREINDEIASIAFSFLEKTYIKSNLVDTYRQTNTEYINILDMIFQPFITSIDLIVSSFKHNIVEKERIVRTSKARQVSKATRKYLRTRPYLLKEKENGPIRIRDKYYQPLKVIEKKKTTSINIFENQLVKYMIKDILIKIEYLEKILNRSNYREKLLEVEHKYKLENKKNILRNYLKYSFKEIDDISPRDTMSLIFQKAPGYREAYKNYKLLSKGLDLGEDIFKISPKKIYELYESWCYIKLHQILDDLGYNVSEYGIIDYKDNGLFLNLNRDKEASMIYQKGEQKLRLHYNKSYSLPTTMQRPDTVLCIENLNSKQKRTYIFDAKYRLKLDENTGIVGPLEEDINVMHRYRDAIVSKMNSGSSYKYETFGAYVMFPCSDEREFINHKFYKSIEEVNVGAFPMLPGSTNLIKNHLKNILKQTDLEAKDSRLNLDEFDDYARFKKQDVMLVNTIDREHLEIFHHHRFYHIPKAKLSNIRPGIEYIAFYQPKSKFNDEAGVHSYAKIKRVYTYRRKDSYELRLKDGEDGNETYLRFELGPIKKIPKIEAYEIGPVSLSYTNLYLLYNAENTRELQIKSSLEMKVYKLLRSIAEEKDLYLRKLKEEKRGMDTYKLGELTIDIVDKSYIRLEGKTIVYRELRKEILDNLS